MNSSYLIPLEPGNYYHIYNRGNNGERIFYSDRNYSYFLDKYRHYISPYVHTLAYCLLPNHFHLLVKIRSLLLPDSVSRFISDQFRKMFIAYSMAINKQQARKGSLFYKNFRRKKIADPRYLIHAVHYIHHNPLRHGTYRDVENYSWSSYRLFFNGGGLMDRNEIHRLFGDENKYIVFHRRSISLKNNQIWVIED